jgi:multiple sugar transport system substrate-binding protein
MNQEQQMRQRLLTVLNAKSSEIDVFMTLPSRNAIRRLHRSCPAD